MFIVRLGSALNGAGYPHDLDDRAQKMSQVFSISKYTALSILRGVVLPSNQIIDLMASELGVLSSWLLGLTDKQGQPIEFD